MRVLLIKAIGFLIPYLGWSQLSIDDYLNNAINDEDVKMYQNQSDFLDLKTYRTPYINRLQFRTENDEFQSEGQEYGLRLKANSPWERANNNKVFETEQEIINIRGDLKLKELLVQRYLVVLQLVHLNDLLSLNSKESELISKQLEIYSTTGKISASELVEYKLDQVNLKSSRTSLEAQKRQVINYILGDESQGVNWTSNDILSPYSIFIDSLEEDNSVPSIIKLQEEQINLVNQEYELEKSSRDIGFIQTDYRPGRDPDRQFEISLGINIPVSNNNKDNMTKRKLELVERERKLERTNEEILLENNQVQVDLMLKLEKFQQLDSMQNSFLENTFLNSTSSTQNAELKDQVELKQALMRLEKDLIEARHEVLVAYVDYLSHNETLHTQPIINYLKKD